MKVKYIGRYSSPLSLITGRIYECISVEKGWYRIVDETNEDYLYPPDEFEVICGGDTMDNEYICDDRNMLENAQKLRSMTDEEFDDYIKSLDKEQNKD